MARPKTIRAPTTASLPSNLRIPSTTPSLIKSLGKLSRQSLLDLVFQWLDDRNTHLFPPFLERDERDSEDEEGLHPYPAEPTLNDVRNAYQELQVRKGGKREVIDRILDGDWRHGITLRQLAMIDLRYVDDHPSGLRWTALELARIGVAEDCSDTDGASACIPRVHTSTFLKNLQEQISPLVKAHFYLARSSSLPLTFVRILVTHSPYQTLRQAPEALTDSSRVMYIAFPDSCPFIYTSIASAAGAKSNIVSSVGTDTRSLQRIVRDAVPKALSLSHQRYTLKATSLTAKSLHALLALRGPGRSNKANGAFSIFADAVLEGSPLDPRPCNTVSPEEYNKQPSRLDLGKENKNHSRPDDLKTSNATSRNIEKHPQVSDIDPRASKKRRLATQSRFGTVGSSIYTAPLDRLDVQLLDPPNEHHRERTDDNHPQSTTTAADQQPVQPSLFLTFSGSDVISGIRKLAEVGIVDPDRMPSWMTGEEAVSVAVVRRGKHLTKDGG